MIWCGFLLLVLIHVFEQEFWKRYRYVLMYERLYEQPTLKTMTALELFTLVSHRDRVSSPHVRWLASMNIRLFYCLSRDERQVEYGAK